MEKEIVYNKPSFEPYYDKRIKETFGFVESTNNEMHELYFRLRKAGYKLEQIADGIGTIIGSFHGHDIFISLRWYKINDVLVGFFDPTSVVVNHDMIKQWFKKYLPHVKRIENSSNYHNVLRELNIERDPEYIKHTTVPFLINEHKVELERLDKKEFKLKHFALFAKGWYKKSEDPKEVWEQVRVILYADNYQPDTTNDILSILISNVMPCLDKSKEDIAMQLISAIEPTNTHTIGYSTKQSAAFSTADIEYDYKTAVLYFLISKVKFMHSVFVGKLPLPTANILPLANKLTKEDKALFA